MILGIDVGGTHTDAVLIDYGRIKRKAKVPTDAENLVHSLLNVTGALLGDENPERSGSGCSQHHDFHQCYRAA